MNTNSNHGHCSSSKIEYPIINQDHNYSNQGNNKLNSRHNSNENDRDQQQQNSTHNNSNQDEQESGIEVIDESLENIAKLINLENLNTKMVKLEEMICLPGSNVGDNYMSETKRIIITGKDLKGREETMSLFIKRQIPVTDQRRRLFQCDVAFNNEINAYKYVVPILEKYSGFTILPRCHFSGTDELSEIIILEDLKSQGFSMQNRRDLSKFDFSHCRLVINELAKFHAAAISCRELDKELYEENTKYISDIVYTPEAESVYKDQVDSSINNTLYSLEKANKNKEYDQHLDLIKNLSNGVLFSIVQRLILNPDKEYTIICHGDLWVNNIMFKWNERSEPIEVKFFDLQAMRITSPVFDILHLIYTSTTSNFRRNHLDDILKFYHNSLIDYLELYFLPKNKEALENVKKIFSYANIMKQYKSYQLYGFMIAAWFLPAVTFDPDNIPTFTTKKEKEQKESDKKSNITDKLTEEYHILIKEVVSEFYNNDLFNMKYYETQSK